MPFSLQKCLLLIHHLCVLQFEPCLKHHLSLWLLQYP
jgi:hypothetical protein